MKIIKVIVPYLITILALISCDQEVKKQININDLVNQREIPEPFRFHKAIEVKPGLTLDVVSWGRGSESVGAYMVLRSDSTHMKYKSISGELDGKIIDAWNMDMDSDGSPELFIQSQGQGDGSHLNMYVYEYDDNGSTREIDFPNLSGSMKKGYKGQDSVYIKDEKLMRSFPIYAENDSTSISTGEKRLLEYSLRKNSFSVKELEK